jgi:hypothetical protein
MIESRDPCDRGFITPDVCAQRFSMTRLWMARPK